ncbi:hypothetical protein BU23DRAFT_562189 [Bimuria novae-zelandiae CBS 107.79]|uniref:Uncharacterized protein n=1 Tax=Bimuria novae-zelandiae CBS 107.79 TaxID=1447943 RepID=A0A6A5UGV6_9PLEO|nr:hypothetical protein BU23DRAFT_562189 [Bimuria novae-zelandiae CBS 107.79]
MRIAFSFALVSLLSIGLGAPAPASKDVVSSSDDDAKVIYPDYRRSAEVTSSHADDDSKVIYPDYRRSVETTNSHVDSDAAVIYPNY